MLFNFCSTSDASFLYVSDDEFRRSELNVLLRLKDRSMVLSFPSLANVEGAVVETAVVRAVVGLAVGLVVVLGEAVGTVFVGVSVEPILILAVVAVGSVIVLLRAAVGPVIVDGPVVVPAVVGVGTAVGPLVIGSAVGPVLVILG